MRRAVTLLLTVALLSLQGSSLAPVVEIVRAPTFVYDDESITIQVRVEPRPDNRVLIVGAWDGDASIRTSLEQLEGEASPRTRWVRWVKLSACACEIRAYVFGSQGQLGLARQPLTVMARWER